ncbi:MAG: SUMF1/EgtB/PvdO family nonheme iron enzyme [Rhodanobacter sp.]
MPKNATLRIQRAAGGVLGILVLAFALTYHFFPRVFHVDPTQEPRRSMSLGAASPGEAAPARRAVNGDELNAGPPLTLAPTAVVAARHDAPILPEQLSDDTPAIAALLDRASKALQAGELVGSDDSAGALFARAIKEKPDSRRAAQGLFDVRMRLVAEADRDIALGDETAAGEMLEALRTLPGAEADVRQLQAKVQTLGKVRPLLTRAAAALRQGKADQPRNGSALALYRQVQQLDPQNAVAEQGIFEVQHVVLDRALAAVAQNNFVDADKALAQAQAIRADSQQLRDARERIDAMRKQRALSLLAQAGSALDAGNTDFAHDLAEQARGLQPALPGLDAFAQRVSDARLYAGYRPGQVFSERFVDLAGKAPMLVVIPTGSFRMGAADGEEGRSAQVPQHTVTIAKGFALARSAVTVGEFRLFVRVSGYVPDSVRIGGASVYDERSGTLRDDARATWQNDYAGKKAADNLPVVNVSWTDAAAYAHWLAERTGKPYRLPSESEFEYALRGGTTTRYWWGDGPPTTPVENLTGAEDRSANGRRWSHAFRGYRDGYWGPAPVMSFAANPFGLYDINGNVSEWVADCWHDNYLRAPADGSAWINPGCSGHVVRGGSWGSSPEQVDSAYRQGVDASSRSGRVGFRVARDL